MINIAIVDDDGEDIERVKECLKYVKEKDGLEYCITEFNDVSRFFFRSSFDFDLIFLDIQMPYMDGLKAAAKIREQNETVGIVFITNMCQLAIKGYEVNALDFILKPVNVNDFYLKMKHLLSRLHINRDKQIIVETAEGSVSLAVNSIIYFDVSGHYVNYHMGDKVISEYNTLKAVEQKFSEYPFFKRCNRYYIVNLNYVSEIKDNCVVVGGDRLEISRSQKTEFCKAFAEYISGVGR